MTTQIHDTLPELRDFIAHQAQEDAGLPSDERRYQLELVSDVLHQEPLKSGVIEELVDDYKEQVAHGLKAEKIAA
jgi:hypothetical protein